MVSVAVATSEVPPALLATMDSDARSAEIAYQLGKEKKGLAAMQDNTAIAKNSRDGARCQFIRRRWQRMPDVLQNIGFYAQAGARYLFSNPDFAGGIVVNV